MVRDGRWGADGGRALSICGEDGWYLRMCIVVLLYNGGGVTLGRGRAVVEQGLKEVQQAEVCGDGAWLADKGGSWCVGARGNANRDMPWSGTVEWIRRRVGW